MQLPETSFVMSQFRHRQQKLPVERITQWGQGSLPWAISTLVEIILVGRASVYALIDDASIDMCRSVDPTRHRIRQKRFQKQFHIMYIIMRLAASGQVKPCNENMTITNYTPRKIIFSNSNLTFHIV